VPILHDPLYPVVEAEGAVEDFSRPLQLLARRLEFTDPVSGEPRRFASGLRLAAWPEG
jgi:tRNA pseudouridine32 synthase/23S rRNA pseudouridine746 synthase